MAIIGLILMGLGGLVMIVCGLWLLVAAFQESILWGLLCLIISPAMLVFVIMNWDKAKTPFLYNLGGALLFGIGVAISGAAAPAPVVIQPAPITAPAP